MPATPESFRGEARRFSRPSGELKDEYDVVVVGSGYGGSIAASRMARAGWSVCLLERGREFSPGEFPDTLEEMAVEAQMSLPGGQQIGSRTGLYRFHIGEDINIFFGCGLGGTSLVNANVSLQPDPRVFEDPVWPEALRQDADALRQAHNRAWEMLQPATYPDSYPELNKLNSLRKSAEGIAPFRKLDINVTFKDGPNAVGVPQRACQNCGDCVSGCNYGAKNTLAMNYIPDAYGHLAEIFTQIEVQHLQQDGDGWLVHFDPLGHGREAFANGARQMFVRARKMVFLCAGVVGTNEIMMRSRERGLAVSDRLGERFSGNGDVLAFAYNCDQPIDSIGWGMEGLGHRPPVGPCITGVIDLRDANAPLDHGMVIEDGSIPSPLQSVITAAFAAADVAEGKDTDGGFADEAREAGRTVTSLLFGPYTGAVRNTQVYLVMSQDGGDGRLTMEDGHLKLGWPGVGSTPVFERVGVRLNAAAAKLGGSYLRNPIWTGPMGKRLVTVHPLGGCCIGESADKGVVDHKCRVFKGGSGSEVYEGLYIVDGSVIPRPLGVNPLLTISTLAERCCALAAADHGGSINYALRPIDMPADRPLGLEFTETMRGKLAMGQAEFAGDVGDPFEFSLTVEIDDLDRFIDDPDHEALMYGTAVAPSLSPEALTVAHGKFNLFTVDSSRPEAKRMLYQARLYAADGRTFYLDGFKLMKTDPIWKMWEETSTLFFTVYEGSDSSGKAVGKGILHIEPADFLRQMRTMRALAPKSFEQRLEALARFSKLFAGSLLPLYGGAIAGQHAFGHEAPPRRARDLRAPAPQVFPLKAKDGAAIRLTRYFDGTNTKGPVLLAHGLAVSSRIFSTDLIDTNLVEYLYAHGYDIWLFDSRQSIELPSAGQPSTGDDVALLDYPAAVEEIRRITGAPSIQAMVHCFGGTTFFMAMMAGLEGVRAAVSSQVGIYVLPSTMTKLKCWARVPEILGGLGIKSLTAYQENARWFDRLFNKILLVQPVPMDEKCASDVCHRITFLFSLLYEHGQLNSKTHDYLREMFGAGNMEAFKQLAKMVRSGRLVDAKGKDVYLPHLDRLAIPITFIHGSENLCYLPIGTEKTVEALSKANGPELYRRHVIDGFGHIDCIFGREAATAVYPHILAALEEHAVVPK